MILGVRPSQAAKCRAERNASGVGVFMTSMEATIGPTPGILAKRRLHSLSAVPGHELVFDFLQPGLQLGVFLGMDDETARGPAAVACHPL